jgi:septal ring factor EnvC (AmiA/AmiB activator)
MTGREDPWHLDKRVPLALILALLVQTAGMVWWAATISSRVDNHDREIASLVSTNAGNAMERQRVAETLARLDERMAAQTELMRRMEAALARVSRQ